MWLVGIVGFFNGQFWVGDGPVCSRCAPSWATTFGRVLYLLVVVCLLLLVWQLAPFKRSGETTPNPTLERDAPQAARPSP